MKNLTGQPRGFALRALEFHSARMWQWAQVRQALDFMQRFGMNALVFHQNDLVDQLVLPQAWFSDALMWQRWPVRLHTVQQNRHYLAKVVREARAQGVAFYLQVKEIGFVDALLERVPGLRNADGSICASDPFWWLFVERKLRELLQVLPDFAGVIVSPGTRESKVSISTNGCRCERCKATTPGDWYGRLLGAMHAPLAEAGKTLVVRDFSYSAAQQSSMLDAARQVSAQIVVSLKNTPHDYYPTFPHNPRIGHTGGLRQWIEYDTWGQFFGLGVFPVSVIEDLQQRMRHALACGAEGASLRTDWEVISDAGAFNGLNQFNVVAGAMLARDVDTDLDAVYATATRLGVKSSLRTASELQAGAVPTAADASAKLQRFLRASWAVMEKTAFVRGHLFHEDGQFPDTVAKAFDMLVHIHGRDDWEPGASRVLEPTEANLALIAAEKRAAVDEVQRLHLLLQAASLGVPEALVRELETMLELYALYVRGFELCAQAVFLTRRATQGGLQEAEVQAARDTTGPMLAWCDRVEQRLMDTRFPHTVSWLLDTSRARSLAEDVLGELRAPAPEAAA